MYYLSISDYAKACKISVTQVYNRINAGSLNFELINNKFKAINLDNYPVVFAKKRGRKPISELLK